MTRLQFVLLILIACPLWSVKVAVSFAQIVNNWTGQGSPGDNWNVNDNWESGVPRGDFEQYAIINDGDTVNVIDTPPSPGAADIRGGSTLNIQSGGSLTIVNVGTTSGELAVRDGTAHVFGGGRITAQIVTSLENGTLILECNAELTSTDASTLNGLTRIVGPDVRFDVAAFTLGSTSQFEFVITDTSHSVVNSTGTVRLGGTLRPNIQTEISGVGDEWILWDGSNILGTIGTIDTSLTSLPPGQRFAVTTRSTGSTNGRVGVLTVEQDLTLEVDRITGAVTLQNLEAGDLAIDTYSISSDMGAIDPTRFTSSLQDDGYDDGTWMEVPLTSGVREQNTERFSTLPGGTSNFLGNLFNPIHVFGQVPEDLSFTYRLEDGGVVSGFVGYVGETDLNNVLLTVDPNSGDAEFKNDSQFTIQIDTYTVRSESGSLLTSWNGLFDQSDGEWVEANPTASGISELNPTGMKELGPGDSFDLNGLYNIVGGEQDLEVDFHIVGMPDPTQGVVRFAALGPIPPVGDYNGDGFINAADYTVWRDTSGLGVDPAGSGADGDGDGVIGPADYDVWRAKYGTVLTSSGSSLATVPELGTQWLLITVLGLASTVCRRLWD